MKIISKCCQSLIKIEGMGDFHDKDHVCTQYNVCTKCDKPCDIMADGGSEHTGILIDKLKKEILEFIIKNPETLFVSTIAVYLLILTIKFITLIYE